jgi:hypothetical protein
MTLLILVHSISFCKLFTLMIVLISQIAKHSQFYHFVTSVATSNLFSSCSPLSSHTRRTTLWFPSTSMLDFATRTLIIMQLKCILIHSIKSAVSTNNQFTTFWVRIHFTLILTILYWIHWSNLRSDCFDYWRCIKMNSFHEMNSRCLFQQCHLMNYYLMFRWDFFANWVEFLMTKVEECAITNHHFHIHFNQ